MCVHRARFGRRGVFVRRDREPSLVDTVDDAARVLQKYLSRGQKRHAFGRASKERYSKLCFEALDVPREGRLRDVQTERRASQILLFRHGDEVLDLSEAHAASLSCAYGCGAKRPYRMGIGTPPHERSNDRGRMGIVILSHPEQAKMRRAGRTAAATLAEVGRRLRPGITTAQIDGWVREDTAARGGTPSQLGYHGFPAAVCTSRNHVVCHGIPHAQEFIWEGDIINVDVTTRVDGFHGDTSATFTVGKVSPEAAHVVTVAQLCRDAGVAALRPGRRLGEVGTVIEELARSHGCTVVCELGGHGIGRRMHEPPHVHHHAHRGGPRLRPGMALTIEPMVNLGTADVTFLDDGWTVVTRDGRLSAQFEHTVLITEDGHEILTVPP